MIEKLISLICEELGYEEGSITENTELDEIVEDGVELEKIIHVIECEFYVDLSEEISGDMTLTAVAELLE
jgi:hypothetical protein